MTTASKHIPWPRVLVEGVVIVGSILLAFGIQAGWDARQEGIEEQRILRALQNDLKDTRASVTATLENNLETRDSVMALLRLVADPSAVTPSHLNNLMGESITTDQPVPTMSTYKEIVSSGKLGLIQSDSLRSSMDRAVQLPKNLKENPLAERTVLRTVI